MIERCKSLLLLALIAICIRFTGLYFARVHAPPLFIAPGESPPFVEDPEHVIPSSYIDLFSPHYVLVHNRESITAFKAMRPSIRGCGKQKRPLVK